ncbi:MFS transporter [Planosporangium mesophilum]|uniref:MFS transporter n=1 Tax=Planosporangium mesophilum TaxID=689768 RepID=A0A8J3TAG7_9ACTN|nr:MFS transporter [Planosporangium mesophilum]NJC82242.1 MFS transporter [Planosporangium mesophilum]GII22292.1 MFS transporter [Planosporangium mesophilum]
MPATASPLLDTQKNARNLRAVLAARGFRRLLGVRLVSQISDGWFQAGLAGSVLFNPEKRTDPLEIAIGFAVLLLPYSLIGPYVGVFLDRWSRRSIIVMANALRALLVLPTVAFIWYGTEHAAAFVGLALLVIGLNRFFLAGLSAAIPHVVEDRRLVTANALSGTLGSICFSLGLGTAVILVKTALSATLHGYALLAALAPVGYLASALLARWSFRPDELGPEAGERRRDALAAALVTVAHGMVRGVRHLASRRGAAYAVLAQSAFRALYGVLALAVLLLYRQYFHPSRDLNGSISGLGMVFVAGGAGVLIAAFLTPPVTRRFGGWRWVAALLMATAVVVVAFGLPFRPGLLVIAVVFVNIATQGIKIVVDTALQHECEDAYRGRVFSVNDTLFNLCFVVGLFVAALVLPPDGHSAGVLLVVGIGYAVVAAWYTVTAGRWARRVGDDIVGARQVRGGVGRGV